VTQPKPSRSVTAVVRNASPTETTRNATNGVAIVYYLRLPDGNIKIGTSRRPLERLTRHRRDKGDVEVLAVEFGSYELEHQRHAEFTADRIDRTETFAPSAVLMAHIQTLREALNLTA
jgi:hypothetical protein